MERNKDDNLELLTSNLNFKMLVEEPVFRFVFTRDLIVDEEPALINGQPLPLINVTAFVRSLEVWSEEKGKALLQGKIEGTALYPAAGGMQEISYELEEFFREVELPEVIPGMELSGNARICLAEEAASPLEAEGKVMFQLRVELEVFITVLDHRQMNVVVGVKDIPPDKISRDILFYEELLEEKAFVLEFTDSLQFQGQPPYVRLLGRYLKDLTWEWAKEGISVKGEVQTTYYYYDSGGEVGFRENKQFFHEHIPLAGIKQEAEITVFPCIEAVNFELEQEILHEMIKVHLLVRVTREVQQEVLSGIEDADIKKDYVTLYRGSAANEESLEIVEQLDLKYPREISAGSSRLSELNYEIEEGRILVEGVMEKNVFYIPSQEEDSLPELEGTSTEYFPDSFTVEEEFSRTLNVPGIIPGQLVYFYVNIKNTEFSSSNSTTLQITHGNIFVKGRQKQEYTVIVPSRVPKGTSVVIYSVQPGDSLLKIARVYGINISLLAEANEITEEYDPEIGEKLFIPLFLAS